MAATDQNDNLGTVESSGGRKKGSNILLIIAGALVFLLVVAVGGFLGYTKLPNEIVKRTDAEGNVQVIEQKTVILETKEVIVLDPFTVNLADSGFIKATFRLGMAEKLKAPLEKNSIEIIAIRDSINRLLMSKTLGEIRTPEGKDTLCEEIRVSVNECFTKNRVAKVYIDEFLLPD